MSFFAGCSQGQTPHHSFDTLTLNCTTKELFEQLENKYIVCDTLPPPGFNNFYMIRFAPMQLFGKKAALMAITYNDTVVRYDWFIDSVEDWTVPMFSRSDMLKDMHPGTRNDYEHILANLTSIYGKPFITEGNTTSWVEKDITVTYSDSLRSVHIERVGVTNKVWLDDYYWSNQRTKIDSSLATFRLGRTKKDLLVDSNVTETYIDTLNGHTVTIYSALYKHWGIPGEISYIFDSTEKNIGISWYAGTTTFIPTLRNTKRYYLQLSKMLGESTEEYPEDGKVYWENATQTSVFTIKPYHRLMFAKYYNEWLKNDE